MPNDRPQGTMAGLDEEAASILLCAIVVQAVKESAIGYGTPHTTREQKERNRQEAWEWLENFAPEIAERLKRGTKRSPKTTIRPRHWRR